jgi:hypothetical protein
MTQRRQGEDGQLHSGSLFIVSKNGKYGIYDREKNDSVTAVDMDYIEYSHYFQPEDGMCFCYFYYEKGLKCGKIGINMNDNTKMEALPTIQDSWGKWKTFCHRLIDFGAEL